MTDSINIAEKIFLEKEGVKEGQTTFKEIYKRGTISFDVRWKRKIMYLKISIEKPYPGADFIPCKINKSTFLSAILRYTNFNIYGTISKFSDFILANNDAMKLMTQKNASIELLERSLIYTCKNKNCPQKRLEILIALAKKLSDGLIAVD